MSPLPEEDVMGMNIPYKGDQPSRGDETGGFPGMRLRVLKPEKSQANQLVTSPTSGTHRLTGTDRKFRTPFSFLSASSRISSIQIKTAKGKFNPSSGKRIHREHLKCVRPCALLQINTIDFVPIL